MPRAPFRIRLLLACCFALALLAPCRAAAQDPTEPRPNRIYAALGGHARVAVASLPGLEWQVVAEASGAVVRPWRAAEPGGQLRVPVGGWYRLMLRRAGTPLAMPIGGRFAVGSVILITGQSQAESLFHASLPQSGAHAAGPQDPMPTEPAAALLDCSGPQAWCAGDHTIWQAVPDGLGVRLMLAALTARLRQPVGLVNAAFGGASAAQLADPAHSAGHRLQRLAASGAPLSAAMILGHGTTDVFFPTPAEAFEAALRRVVATLRAHGAAGMPVLLSLLPPLAPPSRMPGQGEHWPRPLGLPQAPETDAWAQDRAEQVRMSQRRVASAMGLRGGGDLSGVRPGPDGVHWSEEGVREAARVSAAALLQALVRRAGGRS